VLCKTWKGTFRIFVSSVLSLKIVTNLKSEAKKQSECAKRAISGYFLTFYRLLVDFSNVFAISMRTDFFFPPTVTESILLRLILNGVVSLYFRVLRICLLILYKNTGKFFDVPKNALSANGGLWHQRKCFYYVRLNGREGKSSWTMSWYFFGVEDPKKKRKAVPLQAWTGPEGSRRPRLPVFYTICT
jgi:hypothetical protein